MGRFRKAWMPWKAADQFSDIAVYHQWLDRRLRVFNNVRLVALLLATGLLLAGYILERRPVMLATILPLAVALVLTLAIEKTEAALKSTTESEP